MNQQNMGAFITQQRKEQQLTQQELADILHLTDKAISKWETGRSYPDIALLLPLSKALNVRITELLNGRKMTTNELIEIKLSIEQLLQLSTLKKKEKTKQLNFLFLWGLVFIVLSILNLQFSFIPISNAHIEQGLTGACFGLGIGFECVAFYYNIKH